MPCSGSVAHSQHDTGSQAVHTASQDVFTPFRATHNCHSLHICRRQVTLDLNKTNRQLNDVCSRSTTTRATTTINIFCSIKKK